MEIVKNLVDAFASHELISLAALCSEKPQISPPVLLQFLHALLAYLRWMDFVRSLHQQLQLQLQLR
ncbi:MAG: hypothetical protein ORN51_06835, partial [Akkermansiaceae bacterium]|nr:hypothetical protein [Akkermansiaceae bacterium]